GDRSSRSEWRGRARGGRGKETEERERGRNMGGGQGPFKRDSSECAQVELFVAAAEDISHQNPKDRSVQIPDY
ncbi:hypothetical protein ACQP3C_27555, partial [Escherichia coli]